MSESRKGPLLLIAAGTFVAVAGVVVLAIALSGPPLSPPATTPATTPAASSTPAPSDQAPAAASEPATTPSAAPAPTLSQPVTDPSSVAGAYEAAGHWWVSCDAPEAVLPQEYEYGCAIRGHEPAAGTLLSEERPVATASPIAQERAAQLLQAWVPFDSSAPAAWRTAFDAFEISDLPAEPVLAWSSKAASFEDAGFRAMVRASSAPQLLTASSGATGTHLTFEVEVDARYSIARSCLPDDVAAPGDEHCELAHLEQTMLWTVIVDGDELIGLIEPDPFARA